MDETVNMEDTSSDTHIPQKLLDEQVCAKPMTNLQ